MARPIITLTTDFGSTDSYVAVMKAVLIRHSPDARLIDVTHHISRHDILSGSIALERAIDGFPPGTVHLAVVDPGVGTDRRLLVGRIKGQTVVCPDNGLITWAWRRLGGAEARELFWRPERSSNTFQGRDIMAPVAGMLAAGRDLDELARPIADPLLLEIAPVTSLPARVQIIHIDGFGNAATNLTHDALRNGAPGAIRVHGQSVGPLMRTYGDAAPGGLLALIGSSGLLEIAVRDGSAAQMLGLKPGDEVEVE